jgi:hypothetical protein
MSTDIITKHTSNRKKKRKYIRESLKTSTSEKIFLLIRSTGSEENIMQFNIVNNGSLIEIG